MAAIIVVEDDPELREEIVAFLNFTEHSVTGVSCASALYRAMVTQPCDLVVLDLGLPDEDGLEVAAHLANARRDLGVVIVTARNLLDDRLKGLRSGADSYLIKPVDLEELEAVIETVLRRLPATGKAVSQATAPVAAPVSAPASPTDPAPDPTPSPAPDQGNRWRFDPVGWRLTTPSGEMVRLTALEQAFLARLVAAPGHTVTREDLVVALDRNPETYDQRHLDAVVRRLRRKVERMTNLRLPVRAAHAKGYVFAAPVTVQASETVSIR